MNKANFNRDDIGKSVVMVKCNTSSHGRNGDCYIEPHTRGRIIDVSLSHDGHIQWCDGRKCYIVNGDEYDIITTRKVVDILNER